MAEATLTRRVVVQVAAGAAAGLAAAAACPHEVVTSGDDERVALVPPEPSPGGIPISETQMVHVWAPGPPAVTLPFTGVALQGLDLEPNHDPGLPG